MGETPTRNAKRTQRETIRNRFLSFGLSELANDSTNQNKPRKVASNHLTEKEKLIMNGAIGRVQEKEEDEEPEETSGPKPILPYTSMFVFRSEDQIRVACHYIGIVVIPFILVKNFLVTMVRFVTNITSLTKRSQHHHMKLRLINLHFRPFRQGTKFFSAQTHDTESNFFHYKIAFLHMIIKSASKGFETASGAFFHSHT